MKKWTLLLVVALTALMLAACGNPDSGSGGSSGGSESGGEKSGLDSSDDFDISSLETLADAFAAAEEGSSQYAFDEKQIVYAFRVGDQDYRVIAEMTKELYEKSNEIPFDEERDAKVQELLGGQKITSAENLSEKAPTQEELDKLVGKTCGELFEDGWSCWGYDLDAMEITLYHDAYAFTAVLDYDGKPMENSDDFDETEAFKDIKIKSLTYDGLGDATSIE